MVSINYSLQKISTIVGGTFLQKGDSKNIAAEVLIDSRRLSSPDNTLFVALITKNNDGHNYVPELYEKGVRNFMLSREPEEPEISNIKEANILLVDDTLKALQKLAAYHRRQFTMPVIGISGSNGKTVVKEWLYQLLQEDYHIVRSPKSFNSQVGVPLSVLQMHENHNLAIVEAGISETDEMDRLVNIIKPDIGVFTNIGAAHDENFINRLQKAGEKLKLFTSVDVLVYCSDHYEIREQIIKSEIWRKIDIFEWSTSNEADLRVKRTEKKDRQTLVVADYGKKSVQMTIPFTDKASVENAIHCWMVMLYLGYKQAVISKRIQTLSPVAMRLELKEGINHCSVINDSYNSDITSLEIALDFMNQQNQHKNKTVLLSDILQSGLSSYHLYTKVAKLLEEKQIDRLIGIGTAISKHSQQFDQIEAVFYENTEDFINRFPLASFSNETILLKGARVFEFERINKLLQQQSHATVLEINLSTLVDNYNYFRSVLKPKTRIMAMVKAFSYGSGSFEVANILQYHRVDYLGVAYTDEGVELRKAGITLPLMVMNPEEHSFDIMIRHNLEPEIYSFRVFDLLEQALERNIVQDQKPFGIHLKLDTGMHRLGFVEEELDRVIQRVKENSRLKVESVFSHLAASDETGQEDFTEQQLALFRRLTERITKALEYPVLCHIANTAAITRFPHAQFDMVRLGIGLYGIATDPAVKSKITNVSRFTSTISQIKHLQKGDTVGYNRAFKASQDMKLGTVSIGYADGLSRSLSNGKGKLWVNGKPAPIIGNICMDMCMIDLTGVDVEEGDEVVVFDRQYSIEEMAKDLKTIPYEVLTNVSRRVRRIYYHEG